MYPITLNEIKKTIVTSRYIYNFPLNTGHHSLRGVNKV